MVKASELKAGDVIRIDGRVRKIREARYVRGDVGQSVFYEGPFEGNEPRGNSEGYLVHAGFEVVALAGREEGRIAA